MEVIIKYVAPKIIIGYDDPANQTSINKYEVEQFTVSFYIENFPGKSTYIKSLTGELIWEGPTIDIKEVKHFIASHFNESWKTK